MELRAQFIDTRQDITNPAAVYDIATIVIRGDRCEFTLDAWKDSAKKSGDGTKLKEGIRLTKTDAKTHMPIPYILDKKDLDAIKAIVYKYVKTIPGWETAAEI